MKGGTYIKETTQIILDEFLNNKNEDSKKRYMAVYNQLSEYTKCDLLEVSTAQCNEYFEMIIMDRTHTKFTKKKRFAYIFSFYNYLYKRFRDDEAYGDYINPMLEVAQLFNHNENMINLEMLPTITDIDALVSFAYEEDQQIFVAMLLSFFCGLKSSEIIGLKWANWKHIQDRVVLNFIEQKKARIVPIHPDIVEVIEEILDYQNHKEDCNSDDYIFMNSRGNPMNIRTIQLKMKKISETLISQGKIERNFTLKDLRHTYITHALMNGMTEKDLKQMIGIESDKMVAKYQEAVEGLSLRETNFTNCRFILPRK